MRLFTTGKLVERLRRPIGQIESAIDTLKLQPELSLNDLGYFSIDAETAIDGELRRRDIEQIQRKGK